MISTVLFDAAGTLVEVTEPVGETYARFACREGISVDPQSLERGFRAAFAASPPLAFQHAARADLPALEREWWRRLVFDAFARAAVDAPPRSLERAFAALFAHFATRDAWRVFADVRPALADLRALGVRLGVVSNFDGRLRSVLDGLGLAPAFDAVVLSSECGFAKPDARIFAAALRATASRAATTLHVGDSEELDRRAATDAGLAALRLDRNGATTPSSIASLEELPSRCDR